MKKQAKVGVSSFNTLVLTSMSMLVSATPALANGAHGRAITGFTPDLQRANRAERMSERQSVVEQARNSDIRHNARGVDDRIAERIADRINARQERDLHRLNQTSTLPILNSTVSNSHVRGQSLGISTNDLGEPSLNRRGFELDLSSNKQTVVLGSRLFGRAESVTINVGGESKTFTAGMTATAGEYVAIQEVLGGSSQSISLTSSGVANGGNFSLNDAVSRKVSSLVIPEQVSAIGQFDKKTFEINGDLVNHGTIYGFSTRNNRGEISILADEIVNTGTGTISTILPETMVRGDVESKTSLALTAGNDINNSGTISSSDALTLTSLHGSVTNNEGARVSAAGNLNISTGSGQLNNAGLVSSGADVNINAPAGIGLDINGVGGTIQAAGNINVRSCDLAGDVNMLGGDYLSSALNIRTGSGALTGSVGQVTGTLNTSGYAAHFTADTENLIMGDNIQDGDPTWASTGNISITGNVTANEDITILAGGNITGTGVTISTANSVTPEGGVFKPSTNITIIAGANVSTSGTTTTTIPGTSITTGTATVDFTGGAGGSVTLSNVTINSSSTLPFAPNNNDFNQENGGNVTIVAYANGATGGVVTTGDIITTSSFGKGGNVSVIAGANLASTITVGNISTSGGGSASSSFSGSGDVSLVASQAGMDFGTSITFNPDGSVASEGHIIPVGTVSATAGISSGSINTGNQSLNTDVAGNVLIRGGSYTNTTGDINTTARQVGGNVRIEVAGALNLTGRDVRTSVSGQSGGLGQSSGSIYLSGSTVTVDELVTGGNSTTTAGAITARATTGAISTGLVNAQGNTSNNSYSNGDVVMDAATTLTINSASTNSILANNVVLGSSNGISITSLGSTSIDAIGNVFLVTGNSGNAATISISGGIDTSGITAGFIEIVNNAATTASTNVTVGALTTNSIAQNGQAGSVSVVSSGGINLGAISATSLVSQIGPQARGGSVFISSGGTGANAITVGTINTSALTAPGNIILLSSGASTVANPTNITHGAFTQTGALSGSNLSASLNGASTTIPSTVYITTTLTGPSAINIRPGGYQAQQGTLGTPIDFTINSPDFRFIVPINVGATGDSIFLGALTQATGNNGFSLVTSGTLNVTENLISGGDSGPIAINARGGLIANSGVQIGLGSRNAIVLASVQQGFDVSLFNAKAGDDIVVAGKIDASNAAGSGSAVAFVSELATVYTNDISTFGTGVGALGGGVTLQALKHVTSGDINASSYLTGTTFNASGGGNILMESSGVILTGDLTNSGNGRISLNSDNDPSNSGSTLRTGNIVSLYTATGSVSESTVSLRSGGNGGATVTGNITTASATGSSGGVSIVSGSTGVLTGDIDTSSNGLTAGNVFISSTGDVRFASIDASTSGTNQNGQGGTVEVVTDIQRSISWGSGDIDTAARYTGASNGSGGRVALAAGFITGYDILTGATNNNGAGDGGSVTISASNYLFMKDINTSAFGVTAIGGTGGDVTIAGGNDSSISLNTRHINTSGFTEGGAVSEYSGYWIVAQDIYTNSVRKGGDVKLIGFSFVTTFDINTSAASLSALSAEGGSVEMASANDIIFIVDDIITSATSVGGDATGGSIGMVSTGRITVLNGGIDASATTSGAGKAVAGDVFSSTSASGSSDIGFFNTSATGGVGNKRDGNIFLGARNGNTGSYGSFSLVGTTPAANFFFNSAATVSGPTATISVKPGNINIVAGPYQTIGTLATPVNLTLDFGGDSRLLVPLMTYTATTGEGIFVSGVNANNATVGGTFAYENNGYDVHLLGYGLAPGSMTQPGNKITGNITANPVLTGTAGDVEIFTFLGMGQTSGTISGNSLTLTSLGGSNITASNPIRTDVPTLTARAFYVGTVPATRNVYIQSTRNGTVTLDGFSGVTGSIGSTLSISGGNTTSFNLAENASLLGSNIELITSGTASSIVIDGGISAHSRFSTVELRAASVQVGNAGLVRAASMFIETAGLTNNGVIEATRTSAVVDNSTVGYPANLSLTGTGRLVAPTTVSLSTTGNINFGGLIQGGLLTLSPGQSLIMVAGGNITATGGNTNFKIATSGTAGDAGSFIAAAGVLYSIDDTTYAITLPAGNPSSATGGSIILDGSNGGYIANEIDLSSVSGAGGQLTLIAQGPTTANNRVLLPLGGYVKTGGLSENGNVIMYAIGPSSGTGNAIQVGDISIGENIANLGVIDIELGSIYNDSPLALTGPITTPPFIDDSVGNGSVVTGELRTNKGLVFVFANDNLTVDFTNAGLNAITAEFDAANGSFALPVSTLTVSADLTGAGGNIYVGAQNLSWLNQGTTALTLNADANLATVGAGGFVQFRQGNTTQLQTGTGAGQLNVSAVGNLVGGTTNISTGGILAVDQAQLNLGPLGTDGEGPSIALQGSSVVSTTPGTALAIDVSGKGSGDGGNIFVVQTGSAPAFIDTTNSAGHFSFNISGGPTAGSPGVLSFVNGGDLSVDTSGYSNQIFGADGNGGALEFVAGGPYGQGNLTIVGTLSAAAKGNGIGGQIYLGSNDPVNTMTIGGKTQPVNGIAGYPIVTGAVNGGVTITNFGGDVTALSTPKSGITSITLAAGGIGNVIVPKKFGSSTLDLTFRAFGTGDVIGQTSKATVTGRNVQFQSVNGDVGASNAPIIVNATNVGARGVNVDISAKKDLNLSLLSSATNRFSATGANIISTGTITAPNMVLTAKGVVARNVNGDNPLSIDADNLTIDAGTAIISSDGLSPINVTSTSTKSKVISIVAQDDINVTGAIGGKKTFISLNSLGDINTVGSGLISGDTLQMVAQGGIGTTAALQVSAANLSADSQTLVRINDIASSITLNSISAANGDVDITTGTSAKSLETAPGALITANNGHITLQNNNASKGTITIGAGSNIATSGFGGGDVSILIGGTTSTAGTAPAGVIYTVDGVPVTAPLPAGTFFFGANGITVTDTSASTPTITMNVLGGKSVIFNTGTQSAKAITVEGGGTSITADPPITGAPSAQTVATSESVSFPSTIQSLPTSPETSSRSAQATTPEGRGTTGATVLGAFVPHFDAVTSNQAQMSSGLFAHDAPQASILSNQNSANLSASLNLLPTNSAELVAQDSGLERQLLSNMAGSQAYFGAQPMDGWMSETELSSGHIPGIVYCDQNLEIKSDVSTIVDFTKAGTSTHRLNKGAVLFAPTVSTKVETPHGNIRIDANSVVFVVSFKDGVAIYDIDDAHKNAVSVTVADREVKLAPGNHVLLTHNSVRTMDDINPAQFIGHRNLKEHSFSNAKMFTSEFSIPNAISAVMPVKQLFASKHHHTKQLANHLMKTVAIHMHLDPSGSEYKQLVRPSTTAFAKN